MIRKAAKIIGWSVGGLLAVVAVLYLTVVVINWKDKEPSAAAIKFAELHQSRPPVDAKDNAYVYALGFHAARNEDVVALGVSRFAWFERSMREGKFDPAADPGPGSRDNQTGRTPEIRELLEQCRPGGKSCGAKFDSSFGILNDWLERESWLLDRYQAMLRLPAWRETSPQDANEPLPSYQAVMDGQWLLLTKAMALAQAGDAAGVKALLEPDIRFWRRVLEDSDLVISKMIATTAINRHFERGSGVLRRLSSASAAQAMPAEWRVEITDAERSMLRNLVGEWMFSTAVVKTMVKQGKVSRFNNDLTPDRTFLGMIRDALLLPLFQLQDTINKSAEHSLAVSELLDVPFKELDQAFLRATALKDDLVTSAFPPKSASNPLGNVLLGVWEPGLIPYAKRVSDIEGTRRLAVAAVLLRQRGVKSEQVATELKTLQLTNPYDGTPFEWDPETQSVTFTGREENERRVHRILY